MATKLFMRVVVNMTETGSLFLGLAVGQRGRASETPCS